MATEVKRHVPVIIVGAGPTGVTVATLLAQYGVECLVLERWSGVYPQPRAVHMDDETFRIIGRLAIAEEFAAISRPAHGLRLVDDRMGVLAEFRRDTTRSVHGFPQANMFDQPEFEALLRANLERYPRAELRGNAEVIDIADASQGRVRVRFADRTTGDEHLIEADYLLGCDGASSIVRTRIGARMRDLHFEQRWLVVDVATNADLRQWDGVYQVCDPVRAGTYMRIGDNRYRWEFRLLPGEAAGDFDSLTDLHPLIAPWVAHVAAERLELIRVAEYTFRARVADRWRSGNIFLLGDAAHLTPPFVGQGMGAGLRDAMNLAWKLAGVTGGNLPAAVLDSYQQEREPHTRHMIRLALTVGWSMTAGGDVGNLIRRFALPRLHLIPGLRNKLVDSTTPALHRSQLVVKSRTPGQLAGSLCPNPTHPDGQRLDAALGAGFALVSTKPLDTLEQTLLQQRGATAYPAQPGSDLAEWLSRGHATAAIVRPDRTVMCAGRDVRRLCEALPVFRPVGAPRPPAMQSRATPYGNAVAPALRRSRNGVPVYRPDIYSVSAILEPYPHYERLRRLGPVVWLSRQRVYALPRYSECKAVLRDDKTFVSGRGVALNPISNRFSRGTTLNSDGAEHDQRRKLLAHGLLPRALRGVSDIVEQRAAQVVESALKQGEIDGVEDLAFALPLAVVPDLVGWPHDQRDHLLAWGAATFDILGPLNVQAVKAFPSSLRMLRFTNRVVRERNLLEGSVAHELLVAADNGRLSHAECAPLMIDYIAPSLDTTIGAIASALHLFAANPEQWDLLKDNATLIPNAVNEVLRYESPLRAFARQARCDTAIAGTPIPAAARVLVIYASANRDEHEWQNPDTFDIRRDANRHLGFGQGAHACAGQGLARLEISAMLRALIERVDRIEVTAPPSWAVNNIIRRHERLPLKLTAA